ncbi:cytochrome P [Marssonina coronariae]|uniref:Cytochrome P n=1 Tax=Diplocarpon coronariae TaxID=2795749 RepID=A0A218YWN5_9HELO|nr:cytochrome P [Marssonina coronariae]
MSLVEALLRTLLSHPILAILFVSTSFLVSRTIYRLTLHPLAHIPGPLRWKTTSLFLHYHAYVGDEATAIHAAHLQYGPFVGVSPYEVDISDADAVNPIYVSRGGFLKAPCYANFDIDGHPTIFSSLDPNHRAPRAKAVVPMFSTKSIRENEAALYDCVDRMVERMQGEASTGRPVNVLNLSRSLAVDAVSTHLFRENYNGTSEKGKTLSISAFVDALVAVGRFFYLPTPLFVWLEWAREKAFSDPHTDASMLVVEKFVDQLVDSMPQGAQNYPGRLAALGIARTEVKAQCKDLLFAGTDSTGMNLSTIFRFLTLHPDKLEILRHEVLANIRAGDKRRDIQALPYLSGVVREGLRLSMANPTRLPHVVPHGGWVFKGTHFPAGSFVGCSATELHLDPQAYPSPYEFQPERWLPGNVTPSAEQSFFAFGAGSRACIARNLATVELYMATERMAAKDVLRGARACQDEVKIYEWFNSSVKGEKIELIWDKAR